MLGGLKQNFVHTRTQGPHKRLSQTCLWVFECLLWRYGSALACVGPGTLAEADQESMAHESHCRAREQTTTNQRTMIPKKFSHCCERSRAHNIFHNLGICQRDWEPPGNLTLKASGIWLQNFHRSGETDASRAQTRPCVHQDAGERRRDPTIGWTKPACEYPGVSGRGVGQQWPAAGSGALNTQSCISPFEGGHLRPNYREGTKLHPSTENGIKDLLSTAPPISTRSRFPHSQSLPSGSSHEPLILIHPNPRGQTE